MIAKLVAAALLLVNGALNIAEYALVPPSLPVMITAGFGAVYGALGLILPFGRRRLLVIAQLVSAIGGFMAVSSVWQDLQPLTFWIVGFVVLDLAVIWFCAWAKAELAAE